VRKCAGEATLRLCTSAECFSPAAAASGSVQSTTCEHVHNGATPEASPRLCTSASDLLLLRQRRAASRLGSTTTDVRTRHAETLLRMRRRRGQRLELVVGISPRELPCHCSDEAGKPPKARRGFVPSVSQRRRCLSLSSASHHSPAAPLSGSEEQTARAISAHAQCASLNSLRMGSIN
jgi:hypothetical protein